MTAKAEMSAPRVLGAYAAEIWYECLRVLRQPALFVPLILMPLAFYLLLGVALAPLRRGAPGALNDLAIFISFLIYGVMAPGLCGIGVMLSMERSQGLIRFKRALPLPPAAYVLAKLFMAFLVAAAVAALLVAMASSLGGVHLDQAKMIVLLAVMSAGIVPAAAIGLFVASWFPPSGANAFANTLFIAMMMLGGLFYPLPASLDALKPLWPSFHLQQLGLAAVGLPVGHVGLHVLALAGTTALFSVLAMVRLARAE